jgi:hypothetical protein
MKFERLFSSVACQFQESAHAPVCVESRSIWRRDLRSASSSARRVRAVWDQADPCNIQDRFTNSVQSQVLLDQRVPQCGRAKWSKPEPRCGEAERLTEMTRLKQNNSICSSSTVLPHGSCENRRHDKKRCCLLKVWLIPAIRTYHARSCPAWEPCQTVVLRLVEESVVKAFSLSLTLFAGYLFTWLFPYRSRGCSRRAAWIYSLHDVYLSGAPCKSPNGEIVWRSGCPRPSSRHSD